MARQNLFEVLKTVDTSPIQEIRKIENLFSGLRVEFQRQMYTIEEIIQDFQFLNWKYRSSYLSISEMRDRCRIISKYDIKNNMYASFDTMFNYFEFILNLIELIKDSRFLINKIKAYVNLIEENISIVCDKNNMKIQKVEDQIWIVEKSDKVTMISELYPDIASNVIEYNRFVLKGNLNRKRELLNSIAQKYEGIKSRLKGANQSNLVTDIGTLLNNLHIRHNNIEGEEFKELTVNMPNEELEEWYDRAYDLMLLALMYNDYLDNKKDIEKLKLQLKNS